MRDAQMEATTNLKRKLRAIGTYPLMVEIMTHYLRHWFKAEETSYTHRLIPTIDLHWSLLQNIKDQTEIG